MQASVRAFDVDSLTTVYECPKIVGGFLCGKCQTPHRIGLRQPQTCHVCGAKFSYHREIDTTDLEMYFGNTSNQAPPLGAASPGFVFYDEPERMYQSEWFPMQDIGPTTACFYCGKIVPVGDVYYTSKQDERALCEWCYKKAEKAGRARSVTR